MLGEWVGVTPRISVVDHFLVRFAEAYLNELRDFGRSVLAASPPQVSGEDARRALAIALAAERSCRDSRSVLLCDEAQAQIVDLGP